MQEQTGRKPLWKRRRFRLVVVVALIVMFAADYFLYPRLSSLGGRSFNTGRNASWLHYSWYFGTAKERPQQLAARLHQQQIRYAYFHVRFIKKDGTLRFRYPAEAQRLTAAMRRYAPDIKHLAWIYIGNERGLTGVDIGDALVRKRIVREAVWLVRECGFDGVQWDYEICEDGNASLLALLSESRAALPKDKMISVATAMWLPRPLQAWGWSEKYFSQVAARCDQIAVMGYDSALYWPRHYVWLMRQQAIHVTRAVAQGNPRCRVLLGIPTYEDGGPSHHVHAENIRMALKGVREGLADANTNASVFDGVAIFADYSTDETEAETYRRLWLQ